MISETGTAVGRIPDTAERIPDWSFRAMALWLRLRGGFGDARQVLLGAGLAPGNTVLDYGCGIGSFSIAASQIVGDAGMVYALDIHPLAIRTVRKRLRDTGVSNVRTIVADLNTGLPEGSVDLVTLYDVIHSVKDKVRLLRELHRVLKPEGVLSVKPDHMTRDALLGLMDEAGPFVLATQRGDYMDFVT